VRRHRRRRLSKRIPCRSAFDVAVTFYGPLAGSKLNDRQGLPDAIARFSDSALPMRAGAAAREAKGMLTPPSGASVCSNVTVAVPARLGASIPTRRRRAASPPAPPTIDSRVPVHRFAVRTRRCREAHRLRTRRCRNAWFLSSNTIRGSRRAQGSPNWCRSRVRQ